MVINTKKILQVYDVEAEIEAWDLEHCLPEWYWLSYEWTRYKRRKEKLERELQVYLSESRLQLPQQ